MKEKIANKLARRRIAKTLKVLREVHCQAGHACIGCPYSYYDPLDPTHSLHCISIDAISYTRYCENTRRKDGAIPK